MLQESELTVATPEIDARIEAQKKNLDVLLQRFTEQHPDVISARHLISELEAQKRKEVAELRKRAMAAPVVAGGVGSSLASQELAKMLAASEVQVASLDDLIAMKKAAGRPKDLVAVEELEAIQRLQRERA